MSTWNSITIENLGALTVEALPDALTRDGEIWEGYEADQYGEPEIITIQGHSKWEPSEAIAALKQLTLDHPGMKVIHDQEWDYEEPGSDSTVYVNGEIVRAESKHSQLVPIDLAAMVEALRKALDKRGHDRNTMPAVRSAAQAIVEALS